MAQLEEPAAAAKPAAGGWDSWDDVDRFLVGLGLKVGAPTVGSTTGGSHVDGSLHYGGLGRDYGSRQSDAAGITRALEPLARQGPNGPVEELFYAPLGIFIDNGKSFTPDAKLRADHQDHVHVGINRQGAAGTNLVDVLALPRPGQTFTPDATRAPGSTQGNMDLAKGLVTAPVDIAKDAAGSVLNGIWSGLGGPLTRVGLIVAGIVFVLVALILVALKGASDHPEATKAIAGA